MWVAETETEDPGLLPSNPPVNPYPPRNTLLVIWEIQIPKSEKYVLSRLKLTEALLASSPPPSQPLSSSHAPFKSILEFSSPQQLNLLRIWIFTRPHNLQAGLSEYIENKVIYLKSVKFDPICVLSKLWSLWINLLLLTLLTQAYALCTHGYVNRYVSFIGIVPKLAKCNWSHYKVDNISLYIALVGH